MNGRRNQKIKSSQRIRRRLTRRFLRLAAVSMIYAFLLAVTVTVMVGLVWIVGNTGFGLLFVTVLCLLAGALLFFRISKEGKSKVNERVKASFS